MNNPPLDSKEGIEILVAFAKEHGMVLSEYHEGLSIKHGVSIEGVAISRLLPTHRRLKNHEQYNREKVSLGTHT